MESVKKKSISFADRALKLFITFTTLPKSELKISGLQSDIFSHNFYSGHKSTKNSYQEFGPNYVVKTNYSYFPECLLVILVSSFPVVHFFKPLQNCKLS